MDLRDKISASRRFSEAVLRFRLPIVLIIAILYFFHTVPLLETFSSFGAKNSALILGGVSLSDAFMAHYQIYGAPLFLLVGGVFAYLLSRSLMISLSTTIVQLLLLIFLFLLTLNIHDFADEFQLGVYIGLPIAFVLMLFLKFHWSYLLFPLTLLFFIYSALSIQLLSLVPAPAMSASLSLLWHGSLAFLIGDVLHFTGVIYEDIKKGKAKQGAVALYYAQFNSKMVKIGIGISALLGLALIPSLALPEYLIQRSLIAFVLYWFSTTIIVPVLFSLVPYQRIGKK